jgi:hypothetical protein
MTDHDEDRPSRSRAPSLHDAVDDSLDRVIEKKLDSLFPLQQEQLELLRDSAKERAHRCQRESEKADAEARWKKYREAVFAIVTATVGLLTVVLQIVFWWLQHH